MLVDNRKILKETNVNVFEKVILAEQNLNEFIHIEQGKKEGVTISLSMNNKTVYLNSKYTPISEAVNFNKQFENIEDVEHILFIGTGIGYHIIDLLKKYPNATYSIYEPNIYVLAAFLAQQNLSKIKSKLVNVFASKEDIKDFEEYTKKYLSKAQFVRWIVSNRLYEEDIMEFEKVVSNYLKEKKQDVAVKATYQKRWQVNAIRNLPEILKTPHVFDLNLDFFENKPVIIVSAGPSLLFDLHLIKQIKEKNKAYIFAVGSGVNALIEYGIIPDAFISFDPSAENVEVFEKIKENQISIPLFFGSTIGFESLMDYIGPMYHFFVKRETFSKYFFEVRQEHLLNDKPSVAVMALEICAKLKMGPIIFAGQNCAFLNNQRYADGIQYNYLASETTEDERKSHFEIPSVDGNTVYTDYDFLEMLKDLERYIELYNLKNIYNTTKQGAKIEGAPFINLEDLIESKLKESIQKYSLENQNSNSYSLEAAIKKYKALESSFDELIFNINEIGKVMAVIIEKKDKKIYSNVNPLFVDYDRYFDAIHSNLFYQAVIESMIQVQRDRFLEHAHEIRNAKNDKLKIEKFVEFHVSYIRNIFSHAVLVQDVFKELKQSDVFNN